MAIFQTFFDESGKFEDKRVISFCGVGAPLTKVHEFEEEWKGLLRQHGLRSLTMKRALRHKIKFSSTIEAKSAKERNAILVPFAQCIRKHFEVAAIVAVDVNAYKQWPTHVKKLYGGSDDPHYFAFLNGVIAAEKYIRDEDRLSLICDDDTKTAMNCYKLYQRIRLIRPDMKKKLVAITFADDYEFVPLQAADLLSSLCRLEAGRRFHRDYYEYAPLFNNLTDFAPNSTIQWSVKFYDKSELETLSRSHP